MSKEAMKLARENFAMAKELCDKHSKLDRRIVYGNALITHFDAVCQALAEQPAPMIRGDIRDGLVDDEPAHQHIEHCLWARNGNQPCPHVQPAQQQEPVVFYRCNGCGHAYEQVHPTSCDCMEAGGFDRVEYYTYPPAQPAQPSKPWVGLTDEDIKEAEWLLSAIKEHEAYTLQEQLLVEGVDVFARAIEAKLREKNQ